MARDDAGLEERWSEHAAEWRHPAQSATGWFGAGEVDAGLLRHAVRGSFWETVERLGVTLLVSREYEHLVLALGAPDGRPQVSHLPLPHPSGIAVERASGTVAIASTRNPNQVFELAPATASLDRSDVSRDHLHPEGVLMPVRSCFYPGALYIHDLAWIAGMLHANSVGQNAVVRLHPWGGFERVWWPAVIDGGPLGPRFDANFLQLNSIAPGADLDGSYFSASAAAIGNYRPGHPKFPVDGLGVVFSGATRDVVATGLTRPHSARLHGEELWVDNSGYGEVGRVEGGRFEAVWQLPGWTRGLCFVDDVAFVGTSRVIPRFRQYAPGLDVDRSVCAIHALDLRSGESLGSLRWPSGNQIFAIDWISADVARRLPFRRAGNGVTKSETEHFYTYCPTPRGAGRIEKDIR